MSNKGQLRIEIKGEERVDAPAALFSNFLAVSRVATDVQFDFVFLDLNQVALILQAAQGKEGTTPTPVTGQTVAKIIMPAASFVQLKDQIKQLMADIEKNMAQLGEAQNASTTERRATGS